jgi:hypothetical protein
LQRDQVQALEVVSDIFSTGTDPSVVLREFVAFWREVFVAGVAGETALRQLGVTEDELIEVLRLVMGVEGIDLQDLWDLARDSADRCLRSSHPRYGFEALVVRMATRLPVMEMATLLQRGEGGLGVTVNQDKSTSTALPPSDSRLKTQKPGVDPRQGRSGSNSGPPTSSGSNVELPLDWGDFVRFSSQRGGKVLVENLKRLRILRFEAGLIEGTGPELNVSMVLKEKSKLGLLLSEFESSLGQQVSTSWRYQLSKGVGGTESVAPSNKTLSEDLEGHPALQSLQKVFPGSKVDQIRMKS